MGVLQRHEVIDIELVWIVVEQTGIRIPPCAREHAAVPGIDKRNWRQRLLDQNL
jgi:hypothetical protein